MINEHKDALTGLCKIEIKRWKQVSESNHNMRYMVELMEVALAALTAQPVKLPNPQAYFTWHYGGNAPDDFYEDVQISRHHDEKSVDGTDRYPVYSQHEVIAAIRAAGYEVQE